jgi:hypothetical protein
MHWGCCIGTRKSSLGPGPDAKAVAPTNKAKEEAETEFPFREPRKKKDGVCHYFQDLL